MLSEHIMFVEIKEIRRLRTEVIVVIIFLRANIFLVYMLWNKEGIY